jgi:subtilisin family serine protease
VCAIGSFGGAAVAAGSADAKTSGHTRLPARVAAARDAGQSAGSSRSTATTVAGSMAGSTRGVDPTLRGRTGKVTVMLELDPAPAASAYAAKAKTSGRRAAVGAFRTQTKAVERQQRRVERALIRKATRGKKLFGLHALYSGVAITTDASRLAALAAVPGVKAIHPMTPKSTSDATFDDLASVGAPEAWEAHDNIATGVRIGVIDTGIDYTHADFGGPGTAQAYLDAKAAPSGPPTYPDPAKVDDGWDFAGDAYDATPGSGNETPVPDDDPLDCNGHGSHVAGTAAGLGVDHDGNTYYGPYDDSYPGDTFRIRPGVAPGATIVPLKIFGCSKTATTDLVSEALDRAADPNGDDDPSDHLDVVNLSLGADFTSPQDPDSVAAAHAADLGIIVVAAAGNGGDVYDAGGAPGNAPSAIAVAAADASGVVASFSSRGVRGTGNIKPDITAPGKAVTSVAFGTGNIGIGENGTSMASPHVAGAAALLRAQHPTWPVWAIKAALMDTAAAGVTVFTNNVTATAPPMRAGSGMLQADQSLGTSVLAYSASEPSAVSLSFGTVPVTTSVLTVTKYLRVQSLRSTPTSYATTFQAASLPAGVTVSLPGRVIALPANTAVDLPVTLTVDPTKLKLTADATKSMASGSDWNRWIAEASGWVVLTPRDGRGTTLRVSVYAAPRHASTVTAATSAKVTASAIGTGTLALSGNGFGSGASTPSGTYASLLSTAELQATSPKMPDCSPSVLTGCIPYADARAADVRYVGTSSDVPFCDHGGHGPDTCVGSHADVQDALLDVAISTWGPWRSPVGFAQFYVWWDVDNDHVADAVTLNTRLSDICPDDPTKICATDQLIAQTYLPCHQSDPSDCALFAKGRYWDDDANDRQPLNTFGGGLDTSPYDSDAMVLPVSLNSLERAGLDTDPTAAVVRYWLTTSTIESSQSDLDTVASATVPIRTTFKDPALSAVGDLGLPELNSDQAGSAYTLKLRQNTAALSSDLPAGATPSLLLIHHDNLNGARAQVVPVKRATTATIALSATSIRTTTHATVTVTMSTTAATGSVTCRDGTKVLGTAVLSGGHATCTLPLLAKGTHSINAVYGGNTGWASSTSASKSLTVS